VLRVGTTALNMCEVGDTTCYIVIIIVVATESHEYNIIIMALDEYAQAYAFVVMRPVTEYIVT